MKEGKYFILYLLRISSRYKWYVCHLDKNINMRLEGGLVVRSIPVPAERLITTNSSRAGDPMDLASLGIGTHMHIPIYIIKNESLK